MKIEAGRYYKALENRVVNNGAYEDVTEQFESLTKTEQFSTFPTWEEFREWYLTDGVVTIRRMYDYFKSRIQPLEIGREYEFTPIDKNVGTSGTDWNRGILTGFSYSVTIGLDKITRTGIRIRPIQLDPTPKREVVLEAVKNARNAQDGDMLMIGGKTIDAVIKLLEGEK
jgi:hypothetical protein